jgi:hypothetical protein
MSKRNRAAKAQPDKKIQPRFKQTVVEARADDLAGLAQRPGSLIATAAVGTLQAQAARLGDARLHTVQRQALATKIGRIQGNQHLQRVIATLKDDGQRGPYSNGNQCQTGKIQARLTVGPVGDRYEREADRVAEQVSRADGSFEAGSDLESHLAAHKGSGSPLPDDARAYMEPRFGADFSGVRVHTDSEAVQMNHELSAQAFTHGQDVYFGAGRYEPDTTAGKRLLAHELTHVVQQTGTQVQRQPEPSVQRVDLGAHRGPPIGADIGREGRTIIYDAGISAGDTAQNKVVKIFRSFVHRARSKWHYAATGASARPNELLESGGTANCGALAGAFIKLVRDQAPGIQAGYDRDDDRLNRPFVTTEADIFDQNIYGNVKEFRGKTRYEDVKRCVFPMHSRARVAGRIYDPTVYNGIGTDIIDFKVRRVGRQDPVSNDFVAYENEDYKVIRLGESPAGFGEGFKIISKHPWKKGIRWKMGEKPKA